MFVYAATIFLSAFLLFQVQPLIAKFILPWFGGSAAVWSAALLFFQLLLLAGYFYAHVLIRYLKPKQQLWVHAGLLALSLATLPIIPNPVWKATGTADPTPRILMLLAATVGLPYTLLAATSPLLQAWYVRTHTGAIPYRLFALSNFGSMLALLSYPALVEPRLALHNQAFIWSWGFAAFAAVCVLAAWKSREGVDSIQIQANDDVPAPGLGNKLLWIGLSACASVLLLAVTSHLTQNVAPIPLLWVVPLSLYLLSFILCFESDRFYQRWLFLPLLAGALGLFTWGISLYEGNVAIKKLIPALCGALFVCCMVCHGELSRRRPHPRYLTQFYLMVSVGGAIGGLFVALVSPRLFRDYLELPVAMIGCAALVTAVLWNKAPGLPRAPWIRAALVLVTMGFASYLGYNEYKKDRSYVRSVRNFYGVMHVRDDDADQYGVPAQRILVHGTIDHGSQLKDDKKGRIPTSYFGYTSGISRAIRTLHESRGALRLGVLGLGAGVTATLANQGDTLHYYEINPLVLDVALNQFGFLTGCPAKPKVFMGDARSVLEQLPSENLDFLAMDAFTSDAVPMHLLTREAYKTYLRHLKPDGVLAVHISNRFLDLKPVVAQAMSEIGWHGRVIEDDGVDEAYYSGTTWVVLSPSEQFFDNKNFVGDVNSVIKPLEPSARFEAWTDDFSNIITIIK
jgi:SAM-dependent methyltransferase